MQKYNPMFAKLCYFGYFSKLQAKKWGEIICSCDGLLVTKLLTTLKHRNVWHPWKTEYKKKRSFSRPLSSRMYLVYSLYKSWYVCAKKEGE